MRRRGSRKNNTEYIPVFLNSFDFSAQTSSVGGFDFSPDGMRLIIVDRGSSIRVLQYDLSVAFDISTLTYASKSFVPSLGHLRTCHYRNNGTLLIVAENGIIRKYTLSTPFDITSASSPQSFSTGKNTRGTIFVSNDGLTFINSNLTLNTIYKYETPIAWDLSGLVLTQEKQLIITTANILGITANPIGNIFYASYASELITQYTATNFDFTTISEAGKVLPNTLDSMGIYVKETGDKFYKTTSNTSILDCYQISDFQLKSI